MDVVAIYVVSHPWRTGCWLMLISVGWTVGRLVGADIYCQAKARKMLGLLFALYVGLSLGPLIVAVLR
jgi:hypothetical protein